jgi:hypothetical protein
VLIKILIWLSVALRLFSKEEHFATNDILEILKEKDMFIDNYLHEGLEKQF